ncbi:hypothetical protein B0T14DRAFT_602555 [Immersiella caudata]|uniref:Extracellular membrane protein CFEM domain-containing protein n=1 Tax=Immersiella caudata TaxID=314043 RepID=A0AA40C472_9PEZI|nr:hypothetical protein B0T14DRAFT_602555 [Immersiella caudata]
MPHRVFFPSTRASSISHPPHPNLTSQTRVNKMHWHTSLPLLFALAAHTTANSAATCISPISTLYSSHPKCAQSCLGCIDSNESFAHACDINSNCCQGPEALKFIPLVYGCVSSVCDAVEAQKSWEVFLRNCRRQGYVVDERDTPGGYVYVVGGGDEGLSTGTTATTASTTGTTSRGDGKGTATVTGALPGETAGGSGNGGTVSGQDGNAGSSPSSGLGKGEIIGISLGAVSAVAAVVGLGLRWKHLQIAKRNAAAIGPGEGGKI